MEKITSTLMRLSLLYALSLFCGFSLIHAEQRKPPLITTGHYFDGHISRPLLIQSLDFGRSWQYPASVNQSPLPSDFLDGGLSKYSCNKFICIATGNYYNSGANLVPLLLQSRNSGLNWTFQALRTCRLIFKKAGLMTQRVKIQVVLLLDFMKTPRFLGHYWL